MRGKAKTGTKATYPFIACRPAPPVPDVAEAAKHAAAENPANAVPFLTDPEQIAVLTSKWWGAGGVDLSVQFLDGPDAETRRMILSDEIGANAWGRFGNVRFRETTGQGDVRISRGAGGYWSYLGTDIRGIPAGKPTMNLQGFTNRTPVAEYKRVVKHEFWHTMGGPHEHSRGGIIDLLDLTKTVAVYKRDYGWDSATTISQVFQRLAESSLIATATADQTSIACYQFSGECTKSGKPIPGGLDITAADGAFCAKLYPKPVAPPPPPPPPTPGVWTYTVDRVTGAVAKVG